MLALIILNYFLNTDLYITAMEPNYVMTVMFSARF